MSEPAMNRISLAALEMNQPNWVRPNTAQATQAAYHPTPAAMAPPAPGAPGYPPGHAHGAYNQGAAPHAPYPNGQGHPNPPQGAYPPATMAPPFQQPVPNRKRGCFMACFEAVFCCCMRNTNLGDVNGGDVCNCGDCFDASDMCFIM